MASRRAPTPNPGTAVEMGSESLLSAILLGIVFPVFQHIGWLLLVDLPAKTSLSQPPNAWVFLFVLGLFPPIVFIAGAIGVGRQVGLIGVVTYFLMALAGTSFFQNPMLSVMIILGLTLGLFVYLALK